MGDLDDYDFSTGDAGASNVYNMEAGQIRVGGWEKNDFVKNHIISTTLPVKSSNLFRISISCDQIYLHEGASMQGTVAYWLSIRRELR